MATTALGPTLAGGLQPIVEDGYEIIYYPDVNNDALQKEGKPPVFYWLPNYVHLARKDGAEQGDLMFNLIRFAGVQSEDTTVGVSGTQEVAGGVLSFTATSAPPDHVLSQSQQKIIDKYSGQIDFFWGIRSNHKPVFRPVIILSNITAVSNLSPNAQGEVPISDDTSGNENPGSPGSDRSLPPSFRSVPVPPMITKRGFSKRNFSRNGVSKRSNLDPWYWNMQGQGNGSIDPMGQNAYTALVGNYPTSIMWAAFHGSYSPIFVQQALKIKFWVPIIEITITGNWDKVFEHFSANVKGRALWFKGDIKAEFNNMKTEGVIEVDVKVDNTIPGAEDISDYVNEKTDLVYEKFMEAAKGMIFDPPPPEVDAAEAESGGFGIWGAGLALKYRRDTTQLDLRYHEKRQMSYLQDHTISSSMEGLAEEIKNNPEKESRYFQTIYLDDWPRKLARIAKPTINWPQISDIYSGQPISMASVQIGYPNTSGEVMWVGKTFQKSDPEDTNWTVGITQKFLDDVNDPPKDWKPDKTFIKRKIYMLEPPDHIQFPLVRIQIDENEIDLDPGDYGSLSNDVAVDVRADYAGKIQVGPIALNVELENSKQIVEVTFKAIDDSENDIEKFPPVKFSFDHEDQNEPRYWSIFTADPDVISLYKYQIRVIVKGSLFTQGMEWYGPWITSAGNGPMMLSVPTPEEQGVEVIRDFIPIEESDDNSDSKDSWKNSETPPVENRNLGSENKGNDFDKNRTGEIDEIFSFRTLTEGEITSRNQPETPPQERGRDGNIEISRFNEI